MNDDYLWRAILNIHFWISSITKLRELLIKLTLYNVANCDINFFFFFDKLITKSIQSTKLIKWVARAPRGTHFQSNFHWFFPIEFPQRIPKLENRYWKLDRLKRGLDRITQKRLVCERLLGVLGKQPVWGGIRGGFRGRGLVSPVLKMWVPLFVYLYPKLIQSIFLYIKFSIKFDDINFF